MVQAPVGQAVGAFLEGTLYIASWSSDASALLVKGTMLVNGEVKPFVGPRHVPNSDRTRASTDITVFSGALLSLVVVPEDPSAYTVKRGQTFVEVGVYRDLSAEGNEHHVLFSDYVHAGYFPSWPPYRRVDPTSGKGLKVDNEGPTTLLSNTGATRTITCPTNARWEAYGGSVLNGDDISRLVSVIVDNGTNGLFEISNYSIAAGDRYSWPSGEPGPNDSRLLGPAPLSEGDRILITWFSGGASSGGTARSSAVVEEWTYTQKEVIF